MKGGVYRMLTVELLVKNNENYMTNVEKLSYLNMVLVSLLFLITILNIIKRKELFEIKQMT